MSTASPSRSPAEAALSLGLLSGVAAYSLWGLMPLYLKLIASVPSTEIVAHRILWSIPFGALILSLRRQWRETLAAFLAPRVVGVLAAAALFIALNWLVYVWAVANDRVLEASLGYYINPLVFISTGVIVLREKLNRLQTISVVLAAIGVGVLIIGSATIPWPAFVLALAFTGYGYLRKTTPVGAMPGLFVETCLLAPIAFAFLVWLNAHDNLTFAHAGARIDLLLIVAGPFTVVPLVLFAIAARRLRLTTIGFLQYIAPTAQFFLGLYFGEAFTLAHAVCFGLIWSALALLSIDAVRRNRAARLAPAEAPIRSAASTRRES